MARIHGSIPIGEEAPFVEQTWRNELGIAVGNNASGDYHLGYLAIPASWTSVTVIADMALSFGWIPTDAGQYLVANLSASNPAPTNYVNFGRTGSNSRGPFRGTIPILARWTVTSLTQIQIVLRVTVGGGGVDAGLYRIGGSLRAFPT